MFCLHISIYFLISFKPFLPQLNEQSNRLTEINERLRLYNGKLQDRLAKAVEHKVQAEATLASVKIANEDRRSETREPQNEKEVEAQSLYWETGVGRKEEKEVEVLAGSAVQGAGEMDTTNKVPVGNENAASGDLHASIGEHPGVRVNSSSANPTSSDVSAQREMGGGSEVHAGNEVHAGKDQHAESGVNTDSKLDEIKGVEDNKSTRKGMQKIPSIAQEAEEDDFVVVPRSSNTISKADKRPSSGGKKIDKKDIRGAPNNDNNNNDKPNGTGNNNDKQSESTKETEVPDAKETPRSKKDPNRPRYTLAEMQQVLEERNRFKERVGVLEDVLAAYVPRYAFGSVSLGFFTNNSSPVNNLLINIF